MSLMINHLFLKIANERDSELEACEYLDHFAKKCDFLPESIDEMRLAFIEAIINAKEHAPKNVSGGQEREIFVTLSQEADQLIIQVRDFGQGFDPGLVEKPDIRKKLKSSNKRGWGLMLMEKLMDGVEVSSFPPSGTLIKMVKKRLRFDPPVTADTAREHKRIERLKYILGSFIDLSSFLCQNRELDTGLRSMLRILLGTLGVAKGAIYIIDPGNEHADCIVDIKVKAREKLKSFRVTPDVLFDASHQETLEVSEVIRKHVPSFFETFSKEEAEFVYLLKTDADILGFLILGARFRNDDMDAQDGDLLTTLSRNISSAINTFRLMEQLKSANTSLDQRVNELQAVREASHAISSELEIENLPITVERIFRSIMGIKKFSIALFEPAENKYLLCHSGRDLPSTLDLWSSPVSRFVLQKMEPLFVSDLDRETRFQFPRQRNYGSNSFIVLPIVVQEEVLGLVNLTDKEDGTQLTERDFKLSQLLSAQLGIALKNAHLYKLGITDGLTRLYTSHYFKMRLAQEISRLRRVKSPLSVIMFDLDHFKKVNELYGDQAGDMMLSKIANIIKRQIRFNDIPCRFGGDQFSLILPDTDLAGANVVAEKIRSTLEATRIPFQKHEIQLLASFGVAAFELNMSLEQVVQGAELQLREAKSKGGNVVSSGI